MLGDETPGEAGFRSPATMLSCMNDVALMSYAEL
jgi:hypothetical protein